MNKQVNEQIFLESRSSSLKSSFSGEESREADEPVEEEIESAREGEKIIATRTLNKKAQKSFFFFKTFSKIMTFDFFSSSKSRIR